MSTSLPAFPVTNSFKDATIPMGASFSGSQPEQPQILLQLRQKSSELRQVGVALREDNKQLSSSVVSLSDKLNILLQQKQLQERKSRSLVLLVTDLQRQLDDAHLQIPQEQDLSKLEGESRALRQILVKVAERAKEDQKLLSFLRQAVASGPKAAQFVQRSRYLQGQSELLAKLRSQVGSFSNENLQCSRKWGELQRESGRLVREQGFLRIQAQRIKTEVREHYEQYLQRLNRSKAALVNFNQTQRERAVTEHLVEEVARLQEQRLAIQEVSRNLNHHQESLLEQNERLKMENRELSSFFGGAGEEHRLAVKMRTRVEELRDCLLELDRLRALPRLPLGEVGEAVRAQLRHLEETQDYLQQKIREEEQGKMAIQEKDVVSYFQGVLRGRDQRIQLTRQREAAAIQRLREIGSRRELLQSQVQNLEEGLKYHSYAGVTGGSGRFAPSNIPTTASKFI